LPVCSTADDFHTCELRHVPLVSHPFQVFPTTGDDQGDHPECLACQWQVIADVSLLVMPLQTVFPTSRSGCKEQMDTFP
jgi:hypothetical protein